MQQKLGGIEDIAQQQAVALQGIKHQEQQCLFIATLTTKPPHCYIKKDIAVQANDSHG